MLPSQIAAECYPMQAFHFYVALGGSAAPMAGPLRRSESGFEQNLHKSLLLKSALI